MFVLCVCSACGGAFRPIRGESGHSNPATFISSSFSYLQPVNCRLPIMLFTQKNHFLSSSPFLPFHNASTILPLHSSTRPPHTFRRQHADDLQGRSLKINIISDIFDSCFTPWNVFIFPKRVTVLTFEMPIMQTVSSWTFLYCWCFWKTSTH